METEKNFQNQNQLDGIDRNAWMTVTKQMYYGVLIYSICGVLANVVGPVNAVSSGISMISGNGGGGGGVFNILISLAMSCFSLDLKTSEMWSTFRTGMPCRNCSRPR